MRLPDCLSASFTPAKNPNCFSSPTQRTPGSFVKFGLASVLSVAIQASAADPAPAGSITVVPTTSEASPPATSSDGSSRRFDWSKVPPVTAPSRPGMFIIAPSGPEYYSLWDHITGNKREGPPVSPYALYALMTTPAFDIDFRYLEKPEHEKDIFDPVKRIHLGDDFLLSFGGNFWYRYMRESDARLTNTSDNYHMIRSRFHADFWYQDRIRLFAEFLDARTF